jgi:biotin carboxylase
MPRLVEANPRLAGAYVPELLRHAAGIDLIDLSIRNLLSPVVVPEVTNGRSAVMRFLVNEREGKLATIAGLDAARVDSDVRDVSVYPKVGALLKREGDFRARVGHVIASGPSVATAESTAGRALSKLELHLA